MQIIIDTKKDSPEEIKKAIGFLNSLVGSGGAMQNDDVPVQEGMFNMFNNDSPANPSNNEDLEDDEEAQKSPRLETY